MAGFFRRRVNKAARTTSDWMELGITGSILGMMRDIIVKVFMPWKSKTPVQPETFEEAVARLGLHEQDLKQRESMFLKQAGIYLILGFFILLYGVYLAVQSSFNGLILCLVVSFVALANAFRAHFWYYQTKHRKLGCSFQEWLNSTLKG